MQRFNYSLLSSWCGQSGSNLCLYSIINLTVYGHSSMGCMESVESFECLVTLGWIMGLIPEPLVLPPLIIDQQFWEAIEGRAVNDGYKESSVWVTWGSTSARVQVRHLLDPSSPFPDKIHVDSAFKQNRLMSLDLIKRILLSFLFFTLSLP